MAVTALTVVTLPGPWAIAPSALVFTAGDVANGNSFICDGMTFLIIQNSSATTTYTATVTGVADASTGRVPGIAADTFGANAVKVYQIFPVNGWRQSDLTVHVSVTNAALKLAACRIAGGGGFGGVN